VIGVKFASKLSTGCKERTLQAVTALGLLTNDVENRVDELGTLGVIWSK
jgi:hypothetical protein